MFDSRMRTPSLLVFLALSPLAAADTIYLSNGQTIADVTVQTEELLNVTYKDGNNSKTVASDKVLSIDFERMPQALDRAEASVKDQFLEDALIDFEEYVEEVLGSDKPLTRYKWSTAYALNRILELRAGMGDHKGTIDAADDVIAKAANSRYLPGAYLRKAEAIALLGKPQDAVKVVDALGAVITEQGLSARWELERDLAKLLYDDTVQAGQRQRGLEEIIARAGSEYPVVRNRARVAIGEGHVQANKLAEAEKIFAEVTADPKADDRTLAAAYTGLGDCLFQKGVNQNQSGGEGKASLEQAILNYMRVAVVYKSEVLYTPKADVLRGAVLRPVPGRGQQGAGAEAVHGGGAVLRGDELGQ